MSDQYTNEFLRSQNRHWWCVRWNVFRSVPCASEECRGTATLPVDETDMGHCYNEGY